MRVFDCGLKTRALDTVLLAPNGELLAASGHDCRPVVVWDVATGAEHVRFTHGRFDNVPLQFLASDGHLLLSTHDGWVAGDPTTGSVRAVLKTTWRGGTLAHSPEGDWTVYWHEYSDTRPTELHAAAHFGSAAEVALWSAPLGNSAGAQISVQALACLPGAERFLSAERWYPPGAASYTRRLAVRSRADGRILMSAEHPADWGDGVSASSASETIVIRYGIWLRAYTATDLSAPPRVVKNSNRKHFTGVAFHPGGRYVAVTSTNTVRLFDLATWDVAKTYTWDAGKMRSVAFSPDGSLGAAGTDAGTVVVWDVDP